MPDADAGKARILLTGATGQVGWELAHLLAYFGEVFSYDQADLNLADEGAIREAVQRIGPALIVNAAAYTAVDQAESEPELGCRSVRGWPGRSHTSSFRRRN